MSPARLLVVHWNQPAACTATVGALLAQQVSLQITVIDNYSEEPAFQQLRTSLGPEIEIVRLESNRGWGGALNVLLQRWLSEETSSYCFISAHDTRVEAGCLPFLLQAVEEDPRLGIVCPQYPEPFVARLSSLRGVHPETAAPLKPGAAQEVDVPHGTLMLVRRKCLQEIGLFDERYFAYGDEHELGARARRHGWKVAMVWGAIVINPGTWTASALRSYLFARNSLLLVHDYFGATAAGLRAVLLLGNTLRLLATVQKGEVFSARARWQGVRDFFFRRYGKPKLR